MTKSPEQTENKIHNINQKHTKKLSVAPMLDWTDKHYRYMARQISRHTHLYTEMIHAGAILHGDTARFLDKDDCEHPVALQLGGSDPADLAAATAVAARYGYGEINLNCGCPSPRVQKGSFGACLMKESRLVADCLNAMQQAAPDCDITVKHRIGLDKETEYAPLADFVGTLNRHTDCKTFIVHARNAWLDGLSPKENRDIPPLRYDYVYRLKQEFPHLEIIINGGIKTDGEIALHLQHTDGVMIGRECYHNPMLMRRWDQTFYGSRLPETTLNGLVETLYRYMRRELAADPRTTVRHMCRHYLGLAHGMNGARHWRRILSDAALLQANRPEIIFDAQAALTAAD